MLTTEIISKENMFQDIQNSDPKLCIEGTRMSSF